MPGGITTREYTLDGFDSIRAARFDIELVQSNKFRVVVRADDKVMARASVRQSGKTLVLRTWPVWWRFGPLTLEATIEMPSLASIELSEAATARLDGFHGIEDLDVALSGASEVRGQLEVADLRFVASGASRVRFTGKARHLSVHASGASSLDLERLMAQTAEVDLSGASHVRLNVSSAIESISASGPRSSDTSASRASATCRPLARHTSATRKV